MFSKFVFIENQKQPSKQDILDAINHASEVFDIEKQKFNKTKLRFLGNLSLIELNKYDDLNSWLELSPDDSNNYASYRGHDWEERSKKWNIEGIPPVIIVTSSKGSVVGDGRGRINFANMHNLKVPTWELVVETNKEIKPSKKLLLLVHPDIVFEMDFDVAQRYYKAIEDDIGRFDHVIVHLFYSDRVLDAARNLGWGEAKQNLYKNFLKLLKRDANVVLHDSKFSASFQHELPFYLIDNPGTTIYFAGGYKDLCVKLTEKALDEKLGDIIKATDTKTTCYKPLLVNYRQENWIHVSENINQDLPKKNQIKSYKDILEDFYKVLKELTSDKRLSQDERLYGLALSEIKETYRNYHVKTLGLTTGSTREVFILDDVVLKFNKRIGIENKKEIDNATCLGILAPKIIDYEQEYYRWLAIEKVDNDLETVKQAALRLFPHLKVYDLFGEPFTSEQPNLDNVYSVQNLSHHTYGDRAYERLAKAASAEGKEWLDAFVQAVKKCKFNTYDLSDFNWGVSLKTRRLIPLDLA